ncbi:MAG: hypothetical protein IAF94_25160 [Pirellulaceae bacterium]|nr:hypothetical protein [Pirellulaceae bacterium]
MDNFIECSFLIPLRRDAALSDGELHPVEAWEWLRDELYAQFGGQTLAPGLYQGFYQDPDTGEQVLDESYRFIVAVSEDKIPDLRRLLQAACVMFAQKCIYFSRAGIVEFIKVEDSDGN